MKAFGVSRKFWVCLGIWFAANTIGTYLRLYPLTHYVSSEAYEKGSILAITNIQKKVQEKVDRRSSFLSAAEKKQLSLTLFDKILKDDNDKVRKAIYQTAWQMQRMLPPNPKPPYLLASDSYYYYELTENILKTGTISPQIKGSKYFHPLMEAPLGHWEPLKLHPYVGYLIHRIIKFFNPDAPLMFSVSFTPLVIVALSVVPFLLICSLNGFSFLVTFVGAINMLTTVALFERSLFSWYDDDPYNMLFPLLILACLFYGLKHADNFRKLVWSGMGCSLLIPLYTLFWQGWVFLESILILSGMAILLWNHFIIRDKSQTPRLSLFFTIALAGPFLGVGVMFGFGEFFVLFREGWTALINFTQSPIALWPDLYIAVGELLKSSPQNLLKATGGYIAFGIASAGVVFAFLEAFRHNRKGNLYQVLLHLIFFSISGYLALGTKRFIFLAQIPLILLFPLGLHYLFNALSQGIERSVLNQSTRKMTLMAAKAVVAAVLVMVPIRNIYVQTPSLLRLIFNDVWEKVLTKIEKDTPPDSIINTWWPPGHFIKALAHRRVTFDGATINVPQSYWLANVLVGSDERQALGLLRILNNSANKAVDFLVSQGFKLSSSVEILKTIAPLNRPQAAVKLQGILTPGQTGQLLKLTHAVPPPSYLLIYNDLVEKNIQLTYVGRWDFGKIERIKGDPRLSRDVPRGKNSEYVNFLWKVSGGIPRYSGELMPMTESRNRIVFDGGVEINLDDMSCKINSEKYGRGRPDSLLYLEGDQLEDKKLPSPHFSYSVILAKPNPKEGYVCVLADNALAHSLLLRLYYFHGKGLKYLKPFCHETNLTGRTEILVYEVDWKKFLEDLGESAL